MRIVRALMSAFLFLMFLGAANTASATPPAMPTLFDAYVYGTPKAELKKLPGVTEGTGEMAGDLLLPEATFSGMPWTLRFLFSNDKLVRISLMERYSRERFNAVTTTLKSSRYELFGMVIDEKALDFFSLIKSVGPDAFQQRLMEMLKAKTPHRLSYAWFDTARVSETTKKMSASLGEFLRIIDADTKETEVILLGDDEKSGPKFIFVDFLFPILDVKAGAK